VKVSLRVRVMAAVTAAGVSLSLGSNAWAHAEISPPVALSKSTELFTLAVPTEKEGVRTTEVELTPPTGFGIDSFVPSPGWKREVESTGSGESTVFQKITWTGGRVPTNEDAVFQFLASPDSSQKYTFRVRQIYSDGSVVDWSGPESSDTPAPAIEAKSSLGGGAGSTLAIVALALGVAGVVLGGTALLTRAGSRPLA
jgi:uncharacterized protein YcnI